MRETGLGDRSCERQARNRFSIGLAALLHPGVRGKEDAFGWRSQLPHLFSLGPNSPGLISLSHPSHLTAQAFSRPANGLGPCREPQGAAVCAVTGQQADGEWRLPLSPSPALQVGLSGGGVVHSFLHCQVFLEGRVVFDTLPRLSPRRFPLRLPANIVQTEGRPRCFRVCTPSTKCNLSFETPCAIWRPALEVQPEAKALLGQDLRSPCAIQQRPLVDRGDSGSCLGLFSPELAGCGLWSGTKVRAGVSCECGACCGEELQIQGNRGFFLWGQSFPGGGCGYIL